MLNYAAGLPVEAELREHIERCPVCREKVAAIRQEQSDFAAPGDAEEKLEEYLKKFHRGRKVYFRRTLGFATAAVFLLVAGVIVYVAFGQPGTSRLKGSVSANVYVKRGEEVVRADENFRYKKGDKIRLGILSPAPVLVTVLVEQEEGWSPIPDLTDVEVSPGKEKILPGSMFISCSKDTEAIRLRVSRAKQVEGQSGGKPDSRVIVFKCEQP